MKTLKNAKKLLIIVAITIAIITGIAFIGIKNYNAKAEETYTLSYETVSKSPTGAQYNDSFRNQSTSSTVQEETNGLAITFTSSSDKALVHFAKVLSLEAGKKYIARFNVKMEQTSTENFAIHLYALHNNSISNSLLKSWMYTSAYANKTQLADEFTYNTSVNSGNYTYQINVAQGAGIVHISDLVITEVESKTVTVGSTIGTLPTVPTKEHYMGVWQIDGTTIDENTVWTYTEDKKAMAKYTPIEYTLTFKDIDGNEVSGSPVTYTVESDKTALTIPSVPKLNGTYDGEWSGWSDFAVATGGNKIFNAAYPAVKVTVTFVNSKGSNSTKEYNYGESIGEFPTVDIVGYAVVWTIEDENITTDYIVKTTNNFDIVAKFDIIEYTITFKILGENEALGTATYTVETDASTLVYPVVPQKDGSDKGEWESVNLKVGGDITVYYTYYARYTVTFKDENGNAVKTVKVTVGEKVGELPTVPTKDGYTGVWKSNGKEISADTVVTENMTVIATYEKNKNSGCGANIGADIVIIVSMLMLISAIVVFVRRKKEN